MALWVKIFRVALSLATVTVVVATAYCQVTEQLGQRQEGVAEFVPTAEFSPEEVIRIQVGALSGDGPLNKRVSQCYRFASPSNRAITGPLERFSEMIQTPEYKALSDARHFLVGKASIDGDVAHVLLTVVNGAEELRIYRCFLSKQKKGEYTECWMTDAVLPAGPVGSRERPVAQPTI